jgi:hypothetical protein
MTQARANMYREWLEQCVSDAELIAIRKHLQQKRAFGGKRFQTIAEKKARPARELAPTRVAKACKHPIRGASTSSVPVSLRRREAAPRRRTLSVLAGFD